MSNLFKKQLEQDGFAVKEIKEDIFLIENFISEEELEELFNIIKSRKEDDWKKEYLQNLVSFCIEKFGRSDVENLVAEGKFEITQNWEDKNYNILEYPIQSKIYKRLSPSIASFNSDLVLSGFATIQRMQKDVSLTSHVDQQTDPSIQYATILYLNDDYSDGELFFKNIDFSIKPKSRSLLIFPGTEKFEHGVKPVGDGPIRYVLVGFIKIIGFYKDKKY
jgi:hypothetical protein